MFPNGSTPEIQSQHVNFIKPLKNPNNNLLEFLILKKTKAIYSFGIYTKNSNKFGLLFKYSP
ncbi:hypothetical protein SAMN04489761_3627 [Tenacibaculum sp. MAR_2009_124]|nr:hypothetical protein SAMN04489761_3627 [Tenacibaculum sp. MAR_2009_124]